MNPSKRYGQSIVSLVIGMASLLALAGAVLPATALARDIYVDNVAGDDRNDGSPLPNAPLNQGPFKTIRRALCDAVAGDRIVLTKNDEPYRECVSLVGSRRSSNRLRQFILEGNGAVLDGSQPVPADAWQFVAGDVFRFQPERKAFQKLFLDGLPAVRRPYSSQSGQKLQLEPLEWTLDDGWIYFRVEQGKLPQEYPLTYAALPTGLTLYKVEYAAVANLVVQGFAIDGVNLNDSVGPCVLAGLTCRGNGRSGVAVCGASQADIRASLVGDSGYCQILVEGPSEANLADCDLLDNSGPKWEIRDGATLLIDGHPVTAE